MLRLATVLLLISARALAADTEVGVFTKTTAPGQQVVPHGLGTVPKALVLWTSSQPAGTTGPGARMSIGLCDGVTSRAISAASQHGVPASNTSVGLFARALAVVRWGEVSDAEADLVSWNATSFTLNWVVNDATAANVHYLLIGGDARAKLVEWAMPGATPANVTVSGVGFRPEAVLSIHGGSSNTTLRLDDSAVLGVTAFDSLGNQWASGARSYDARAVNGSGTCRFQRSGHSLALGDGTSFYELAQWVSMDADGFTTRFTSGVGGNTGKVFSLALGNVDARVGSLLKTSAMAPAAQDVSVGFTPGAVLFRSVQATTQASVVANDRSGLGAGDGVRQGSVTAQNANRTPTQASSVDDVTAAFTKVDNDTGAVDARGALSMLDGGFSLRWTTNDSAATEVLWLALSVRPDGGTTSGADAGVNGNRTPVALNVGCGCSSAPTGWLGLVLLLCARRRVR